MANTPSKRSFGKPSGISPMIGTSRPITAVATVITSNATSTLGTAFVTFGNV